MADKSPIRSANRLAAAIAVPIAIVVGLIVFFAFHGRVVAATGALPSASATALTDTGPVIMPAPSLSPAAALQCGNFIGLLPAKIRGLPQRHVTTGSLQNAAFGDPAILASCGAGEPVVGPTDEIYPTSGVCWYEQDGAHVTVWTTLDRETPVTVTIPDNYTAAQQWVAEFTNAIIAALPSKTTPYNC